MSVNANKSNGARARVVVLGGGPDAEREVSLKSSRAVADALKEAERFQVERHIIQKLTQQELAEMQADVIVPVLHGAWGEGGPLQDLLERDGRAFVGSGATAARHAMDKVSTKDAAVRHQIATPETAIFDRRDQVCPLAFPVVIKPVHEGSTIGLHMCNDAEQYAAAREAILAEPVNDPAAIRSYMIEPRIKGRELTVGVLDDRALPIIEITPATDHYDYNAKYNRDDTAYQANPVLPAGVAASIQAASVRLAAAIGVRHIARVDFLLDESGFAWLLEINTMPGFTDHSLVPMAARAAGMQMPELCGKLVDMAIRDHARAPKRGATAGCVA